MAFSPKTVRAQLNMVRPLLDSCSLEKLRKGQSRIGEIMKFHHRHHVLVREHAFPGFEAAWVMPKDQRRQGVMLYLHGGGYTCGDLEYARGVGSTLAVECGIRVFCAAYRLAPEHPFPAAVEDALAAYRYLLEKGYAPEHIALCGESAGGGLCYSLCMKLRQLDLPLPGCMAQKTTILSAMQRTEASARLRITMVVFSAESLPACRFYSALQSSRLLPLEKNSKASVFLIIQMPLWW